MKRRTWLLVWLPLLLLSLTFPAYAKKPPTGGALKSYWETTSFTGGTFEATRLVGGQLQLDPGALLSATDSTGRYNSGSYRYGRYTQPVQTASFTEAIASWQTTTPVGTWIEVELKAQIGTAWTKWYSMGAWHSNEGPFTRHSFTGQGDKNGTVYTDTLVLSKSAASAYQVRITLYTTSADLTPSVRGLGIAFSSGQDAAGSTFNGQTSALDVPMRSQMVFPDGGEVWCSPTSTSMVMAYWANVTGNSTLNQPVPTVVNKVWDYTYNGAGNWPFNTAYASSQGLTGKVLRLANLNEVAQWTAAGVPLVASIAYGVGQLPGSPIPSSNGHLLVIRGFDAQGNVLTNDPAAASDATVRITYPRSNFESVWLNASNGVVYAIYPQGWAIPASGGKW